MEAVNKGEEGWKRRGEMDDVSLLLLVTAGTLESSVHFPSTVDWLIRGFTFCCIFGTTADGWGDLEDGALFGGYLASTISNFTVSII